jgi:hypothetical protein
MLGVVALALLSMAAVAAEPGSPTSRPTSRAASPVPDYPVPYRTPRIDGVTRILRAVKSQIESSVMRSISTRPSTNAAEVAAGRRFALNTYPMGVIYSGMLSAADATGDKSFADFDAARFQLIADAIAKVDLSRIEHRRGDVTYLLNPTSLDDCGAIGAALV